MVTLVEETQVCLDHFFVMWSPLIFREDLFLVSSYIIGSCNGCENVTKGFDEEHNRAMHVHEIVNFVADLSFQVTNFSYSPLKRNPVITRL